jgi:hypothetical protein
VTLARRLAHVPTLVSRVALTSAYLLIRSLLPESRPYGCARIRAPASRAQTERVNAMQAERKRRIAAGLPVPTTIDEDLASGKLPARLTL